MTAPKLIDDTIGVKSVDLEIFLKLLSAFAGTVKNPALADACDTIYDSLYSADENDDVNVTKERFENWSNGQIKFK